MFKMLWKTLLTYQTSMFHSGRSTVFAIKHYRCYSNINEDQTLKLSNEKVIPELDESQVERAPYFQDPSTQRIRSARKGQRWIDSLRVLCKGGNGGNGLPKFGGVGGRGKFIFETIQFLLQEDMQVINDALGQTHITATSDHHSHLKVVLFFEILKSGDGQTSRVKIGITITTGNTVGRSRGSIIVYNIHLQVGKFT